jgi:hypothetical protein
MFVPDGGLAAREMARVTKPGGIVMAATWDFRGGLTVTRVMADTVVALGVPGAASWRARLMGGPGVRPGELAALWRGADLHNVREAEITIRMDFANFADYWEPASQGPVLPGLLNGLPLSGMSVFVVRSRTPSYSVTWMAHAPRRNGLGRHGDSVSLFRP